MFSPKFDNAIPFVLLHECEFEPGHFGDFSRVRTEHDADDPGGATKFGIDQRDHPGVDVEDLTLDGAKTIYFQKEWQWCAGDSLPNQWCTVVLDACVNPGRASLWWLQHLAGVHEDGVIGPKSIEAISSLPTAAIRQFLNRCEQYYVDLATQKPRLRKYLEGWLNRNGDRRKLIS